MSGADGGVNDEILKIGQVFGRYRVERVLGRGGMGCVYEAIHVDLKKRVAVKVLFPSLASNVESRTRFVREGEAAARVRHPHVVDVDDVGTIDGICYLVMEYLDGEDLSKRLQREGRFSPASTADIMLPQRSRPLTRRTSFIAISSRRISSSRAGTRAACTPRCSTSASQSWSTSKKAST
jgi:serine/threonine protein kinase